MFEIKLYNSQSKEKNVFEPLDPSNVKMYVCGPTVYERAHIGNARPVIVFDMLFRLLRYRYGEKSVKYARNFTDVDDKINASALKTGRTIKEITNETIISCPVDIPPRIPPELFDLNLVTLPV